MHANTGKIGGPEVYGNYPVGWAWAMNTPLRWVKQHASMLGGVRNGMIVSYPGHVTQAGSTCAEFSHLIDLVPTVLDAADLPAPKQVYGIAQKPMDGQSLLPSLAQCKPNKPRTQYFEIGGKMGLYHNGWFLSGDDGRPSWKMAKAGEDAPVQWTLYDLSKDFAQAHNVSAQYPDQMQLMMGLWETELPTEAEWEFAARGGFNGADYAWGDDLAPDGAMLANYWQGPFPHGNSMADGYLRTSPVRHYPPNGYGLYDMIGNVWEWTDDWFAPAKPHKKRFGDCCIPANPRGGTRGGSFDKSAPVRVPRKVMKGGSHLCAQEYCQRYRPAARYAQPVDTSTSHVGFRCVVRI